jgi:hypothetical protein
MGLRILSSAPKYYIADLNILFQIDNKVKLKITS